MYYDTFHSWKHNNLPPRAFFPLEFLELFFFFFLIPIDLEHFMEWCIFYLFLYTTHCLTMVSFHWNFCWFVRCITHCLHKQYGLEITPSDTIRISSPSVYHHHHHHRPSCHPHLQLPPICRSCETQMSSEREPLFVPPSVSLNRWYMPT